MDENRPTVWVRTAVTPCGTHSDGTDLKIWTETGRSGRGFKRFISVFSSTWRDLYLRVGYYRILHNCIGLAVIFTAHRTQYELHLNNLRIRSLQVNAGVVRVLSRPRLLLCTSGVVIPASITSGNIRWSSKKPPKQISCYASLLL